MEIYQWNGDPVFQSAPLTEARGDAGRYNQRNNKNLHRHMRDSVK